jgi:hypothetical protein
MPWKWIEQEQGEGVGARRFVKPDPDHQLRTVAAFTQYQTDICLTITACLDADYNLVLTDEACAKLWKDDNHPIHEAP